MATILIKKSDTSSSVPVSGDLTNSAGGAEISVNTADKRIHTKTSGGSIVELGTNPSTVTVGSLTSGRVTYATTGGLLTDNSALTFDGTNFGIGTSSPGFKLDVGGQDGTNIALRSTGTSSARFRAYVNGSESAVIGFLNGGGQFFEVAGYEQMRLTSSLLSVVPGATIQGLTVGRGAGAVSTNTAVGQQALASNTTASNNTVVGYQAGYSNTTGPQGTFVGYQAGYSNQTGVSTTFIGFQAGYSNTTNHNTFVGAYVGRTTTTGTRNIAMGGDDGTANPTFYVNTTGSNNVALGIAALGSNTTASNNTAVGYQAGYSNQTGAYNTFFGQGAGYLTTGGINTFLGPNAGYYMTSGTKNTIIGAYDGNQGGLDIRTANNYIVLSDGDGNPRQVIDSSGFLFHYTMNSGAGTNALKYNTSTGAVTYDTSSARYKDNIRDSIYGLSHVMQMRSAQFEYKDTGRSDVGLIAEELDPIIPELVGKNKDGQPDSVSYDRMVSVLAKAIQELKAEFDAYKLTHP